MSGILFAAVFVSIPDIEPEALLGSLRARIKHFLNLDQLRVCYVSLLEDVESASL